MWCATCETLVSNKLFCFGFGYSAQALAAQLRTIPGWRVSGTHRELDADKDGLIVFDDTHPLPSNALEDVTHLLISVPPGANGDPVLRACAAELIRRAGQFGWIGYLSTTGVYGNRDGGWVDEKDTPRPNPGRSTWRASAETDWLALHSAHGLPVHVFRLAGIYGQGRNGLVDVLSGAARRIDRPGHVFSRIHVADVAAVLQASMQQPNPGAIYNVCDDEPAESAAVTAYACQLTGVTPPPLIPYALAQAEMSPMAQSFYLECRRVRNARIKHELGVNLIYPSYREGLSALWGEMKRQASHTQE